jgi:5-methylcytosine-specific restriction protein B
MNKINDKIWVDFYREFAEKLLEFEDKREELVIKIQNLFESADMKLPILEKNNQLMDIDPFTVFGLFNKSSLKETDKIKILKALTRVFYIEAKVPSDFESIPKINSMEAIFYDFEGYRNINDIDDLWALFSIALTYSKEKNTEYKNEFIKCFDSVMSKRGINSIKLTSALYWIAPKTFVNLDTHLQKYIFESEELPYEIISQLDKPNEKLTADIYLKIIYNLKTYLSSTKTEMYDFIDLSYKARYYSKITNENTEEIESTDADKDINSVNYWTFSIESNGEYWDYFYKHNMMSIGFNELDDFSKYREKSQIKEELKELKTINYNNITNDIWQFTNEMKIGDIVFVKKSQSKLIGWGMVCSKHIYNADHKLKNIRRIEWKNRGEWITPIKPSNNILTNITPYSESVRKLNMLFEIEKFDTIANRDLDYPKYDSTNFLNEVFMNKENYASLVQLIKMKKNVILQGPPGVGKTYAAKRLAYSIMGIKDKSRVSMIQFHQSYSYEDFIMGYRPTETGFKLHKGMFYKFCKQAEEDSENEYFFIIDEINRGNLSKIFGELFMLIENDKRGIELDLLYADEKFSVPKNVYIIGMMNTADRSLAILDYALRRRFAFFDMISGFNTIGFQNYQKNLDCEKFDNLIQCVKDLNNEIISDETLGEGFIIGHSYFCNLQKVTKFILSNIIEFEIIPLLKEYWFDEAAKIDIWSERLRNAIR